MPTFPTRFIRCVSFTAGLLVTGANMHAAESSTPDPAGLVRMDEAAKVTGQEVTGVESSPAAPDPDSGGIFAYHSFRSSSSEVIVAVVSFATAAEAATKLTKEFAAKTQADDKPNVVAESDLGERAFWVSSESGAEYVVLKGRFILAIGLNGRPPKPLISYRDALRTLTKSALGKL